MNIRLRVSYVDEDGKEFGLEEPVTDSSKLQQTVQFILNQLLIDYYARHPGENP